MKVKIEIIGNKVKLSLCGEKGKKVSSLSWEDKKDLSEKILKKIDQLLKKNRVSLKDISSFEFYCNSPYFLENKKNLAPNNNLLSEKKCGFTAWQVGEITAKTLNFH